MNRLIFSFFLCFPIFLLGQNRFECLIYKIDTLCSHESLISIDETCLKQDTSLGYSKEEIAFFSKYLKIKNSNPILNAIRYSNDITLEENDWNTNGEGITISSQNSSLILNKYLQIVSFIDSHNLIDKSKIDYQLHQTKSPPTCEPNSCNQKIGLGYNWVLDDERDLEVYITTEKKDLTLRFNLLVGM